MICRLTCFSFYFLNHNWSSLYVCARVHLLVRTRKWVVVKLTIEEIHVSLETNKDNQSHFTAHCMHTHCSIRLFLSSSSSPSFFVSLPFFFSLSAFIVSTIVCLSISWSFWSILSFRTFVVQCVHRWNGFCIWKVRVICFRSFIRLIRFFFYD